MSQPPTKSSRGRLGRDEALPTISVELLLAMYYGYHKGPRPRAGARVNRGGGGAHSHWTVVGIDYGGQALISCDDCNSTSLVWTDELVVDRQRERATIAEVFSRVLAITCSRPTQSLSQIILLSLFNGNHGAQFRQPEALGWLLTSLLHQAFPLEIATLAPWCEALCTELGPERAPPLLREIADGAVPSFAVDGPAAAGAAAKALMLGEDVLAALESYVPSEETFEFDQREVCFVGSDDREVAVLGPTSGERDPNWFDVIDVDTGEVISVHGEDLTSYQELLVEAEFDSLLFTSACDGAPVAMRMLLETERGSTDPLLRTLLAGAWFRTGGGKAAMREMSAACKLVPAGERRVVHALLPETISHGSKKASAPLGRPAPVLAAWRERFQALNPRGARIPLSAEPDPAAVATDGAAPPEATAPTDMVVAESLDLQAPTVPDAPAPHLARDPGQPLGAVGSVESLPKPAASAPRALRFHVVEHALLASEWALADDSLAYDVAVNVALGWLSRRIGFTLPSHWGLGGHEIEQGGISLQVEAASPVFAFRLEHPDTQHATRTWRMEASVLKGGGNRGGMVGLRLSARDRTDLPPPGLGVPQLVREWLLKPGLLVAGSDAARRLLLDSDAAIVSLAKRVNDVERDGPLLVLDIQAHTQLPVTMGGLALVHELAPAQDTRYAELFGRLRTGHLHLFVPGGARALSFPTSSTGLLQLGHSLVACRQRPQTPTFRQVRDEVREASRRARTPAPVPMPLSAVESPVPAPPAAVLEQAPAPAAVAVASEAAASEAEAIAPKDSPQDSYSELQELFDMALEEKAQQDQVVDQLRAEIFGLRAKVQALSAGLQPSSAPTQPPLPEDLPDSLADVAAWSKRLAPRVEFADKALRVAARTEHRNPELIYRALQALHDLYWPMRWSSDSAARQRWVDFINSHRLRCGPTGAALDIGRYADAYQAQVGRRTHTMTLHLQGSSTRDPQRCIRIYFHPDDEAQQVIVGHFPTHLDNTLS